MILEAIFEQDFYGFPMALEKGTVNTKRYTTARGSVGR